jgi:two-component system sensor histidine kinase FlrB
MQGLICGSQVLLDAIEHAIVIITPDGLICQSNKAANKLFAKNILGVKWASLLADTSHLNLHIKASYVDNTQVLTVTADNTVETSNIHAMGKMMASLAHQIKTPLATTILYAQLLLNKSIPQAKIDNYILKVNERLHNLNQIIDSLMILVKGVTPPANKLAIKQIKEDLLQYIKDKKIYVDFECLLFDTILAEKYINCDAKTLVSGIGNLINNSIEATTGLAKILILFATEEGWLTILVSDKGPGMTEYYKKNLFEPFVSTKTTGTGLGLSILQLIVKSYHGKVAIESDSSYGTKVTIKFKLL